MASDHHIIVGSCGHVLAQCRCMAAKRIQYEDRPCPACQQAPRRPEALEADTTTEHDDEGGA